MKNLMSCLLFSSVIFNLCVFCFGAPAAKKSVYQQLLGCGSKTKEDRKLCAIDLVKKVPSSLFEELRDVDLPEMSFKDENGNKQNGYNIKLLNSTLRGISEMEVQEFEIDPITNKIPISALFPRLRVDGQCLLKAYMSFIPITGNGTFWMTIDDMLLTALAVPSEASAADGSLSSVKLEDVNFTNGIVKMRFNVLEDNAVLGEAMNSLLNEEYEEIISLTKPSLLQQLNPVMADIILQILNTKVVE